MSDTQTGFKFDNSFSRLPEGFYIPVRGGQVSEPKLVKLNERLASQLQLDPEFLSSDEGVEILSGKRVAEGSLPLAQAYAGHQFGGFSPSLGDGRAMLLGEIIDTSGKRKDIQLKGSGRTPFSRGGDGKAALGPVLREYIVSEAMHVLGVPTTRSLAAVTTGEQVYRETPLPGAVLTRIASSHIRVGTFQYFAARGQEENVRQLADYAIERHYPDVASQENKYLEFLKAVILRQAELVAQWMSLGFIHGVMNTDNMTISGETIDYGPCAFMDVYREDTVFSSIDEMGRYAYRMQPKILQWNLARFAECLLSLIDAEDRDRAVKIATQEITAIPGIYDRFWLKCMGQKIGFANAGEEDRQCMDSLLSLMQDAGADFTITFRSLAAATTEECPKLFGQFDEAHKQPLQEWLNNWRSRLLIEQRKGDEIAAGMNRINPVYIPRNHLVEEMIDAASSKGDFAPFEALTSVLERPFNPQKDQEKFERPAPDDFGPYITYCGT